MNKQATDYLAGLFGDPPKPSAVASAADPIDVEPQGDGGFPAGYFDMANWERRQDASGRWGWERRDIPEADRWWRWADFDDLPEPMRL